MTDVSVTNISRNAKIEQMRSRIREYSDLIANTPIFNLNDNKQNISNMLYEMFYKLYIEEPEELLNFMNQFPSKKLVTHMFSQYGISDNINKELPNSLKTKIVYYLNTLFNIKGSNEVFAIFDDLLKEFYKGLNYYNVRIEQRHFTSRYDNPIVERVFYLDHMYQILKQYNLVEQDAQGFIDSTIEFKTFVTIDSVNNVIKYHIKFFDPLLYSIKFKLTTTKEYTIEKDATEFFIEESAFNSSTKYDNPNVLSIMYTEEGVPSSTYIDLGITEFENYKDPSIKYKILSDVNVKDSSVTYLFEFQYVIPNDVKVHLDVLEPIIIPKNVISYSFRVPVENVYGRQERTINDLRYMLDPIMINDPEKLIYELNSSDLNNNKYLMTKLDYLDKDIKNKNLKNVFPIITNIVYIQFTNNEVIESMEFLPDLVRIFAMTTLQHYSFTFHVNGVSQKMNIRDMTYIMSYLKFKELSIKNPGWVWTNPRPLYTEFTYPLDKISEIVELLKLYKDMKHDHFQFIEFKKRYYKLIGDQYQLTKSNMFNVNDLRSYLYGTIPETIDQFFESLNDVFPDNERIIAGQDQNKIIKEYLNNIYINYQFKTVDEYLNFLSDDETVYFGLNNTLYDELKQVFIGKFPRLINAIDALNDQEEIILVFLENYKRMLSQVSKMDNLITYFINDLFNNYMLGSTFREEFFDPMLALFEQYFFKAEQSIQNISTYNVSVKDKMQMVTCGSIHYSRTTFEPFSEISYYEEHMSRVTNEISSRHSSNDIVFTETTFNELYKVKLSDLSDHALTILPDSKLFYNDYYQFLLNSSLSDNTLSKDNTLIDYYKSYNTTYKVNSMNQIEMTSNELDSNNIKDNWRVTIINEDYENIEFDELNDSSFQR